MRLFSKGKPQIVSAMLPIIEHMIKTVLTLRQDLLTAPDWWLPLVSSFFFFTGQWLVLVLAAMHHIGSHSFA